MRAKPGFTFSSFHQVCALTLKATPCSVLASLPGNFTLFFTFPSPWASIHTPSRHSPSQGTMICICHLWVSHVDSALHSLLPAPLQNLTWVWTCAWDEQDCLLPPPALCAPVSASPFSALEQLTSALSRVLWRLEPNFQMWLVYCNTLMWWALGSVLMMLAPDCFCVLLSTAVTLSFISQGSGQSWVQGSNLG